MGDILEFVTRDSHKFSFYKVSNNSLFVDIKCANNACIGLSRRPSYPFDFEILIGLGNYCVLRRHNEVLITVQTLDALSSQEYRRFWITWNESRIIMGKDEDSKPIMCFFGQIRHNNNISYVTFCGHGSNDAIYWRFEVPPPYLEEPKLKNIVGGEVKWIAAGTHLPDDAIIGGYEQETLYIIRAKHRGALIPGKFVPADGVGYVSWGGAVDECRDFEVLCGYDYKWVLTQGNKIPGNAIEGGYVEECKERLYVGRAFCAGHLIPGRVQLSQETCFVSIGEREVACNQFEVMVSLTTKPRYVNISSPPTRPTYISWAGGVRDLDIDILNEPQFGFLRHDSDSDNENVEVLDSD